MVKEIPLVPLFEQFIKESHNGRRRKINGERIKPRTIQNYTYVLKLLIEYEQYARIKLRITINIRNNLRLILQEKNYWKRFYRHFSDFLYYQKNYFDNFAGSVFKNLKCFFRYLQNDKYLLIQNCFEKFYVRKEEIRIISLLPEQFCFLILDKDFETRLTKGQQKCKDMFLFGCTSALRHSDLMSLCVKDVEHVCNKYFLVFRSVKTDTPVQVKLPEFAVGIFNKYAKNRTSSQKLFPRLAKTNFNQHLKAIAAKAGWIENIGKFRTRNGEVVELKNDEKLIYRFCDQLSSHTMRRTGITILLMLGMPEYLVRKISGHAAHSKSFFSYINFAQSYITDEIEKVHQKLLTLYQ
jgi:integrase